MKKLFKHQTYHLAAYIILGALLILFPAITAGGSQTFWGLSALQWIILSWAAAGIFHAWVLFFWRLEYHYGKISEWFGKSGFLIFRIGFIISAAATLLPSIPVSYLTNNTFALPLPVKLILLIGTTPFILWAIYSVFFYFGINRAFGADHFFAEYRAKPLEKRGTFKYISNSMYVIILLLLYHPSIFFGSCAGLMYALIHHAFVWVHYYCTEKPDLREMYGRNKQV
ncbi:MAG: hypothetical protein JW969_01505 [Spirochaetales bacterium]|nr:hypothetical protein [Spirochaetales bacterium]